MTTFISVTEVCDDFDAVLVFVTRVTARYKFDSGVFMDCQPCWHPDEDAIDPEEAPPVLRYHVSVGGTVAGKEPAS